MYVGLDDTGVQQRMRQTFADYGVCADRLSLQGWSTHREALRAYARVDMALDTQPCSGGLTTCEALWMGVPVVTCPGQTFAGRHATSHLVNGGYPQFVAADIEGYVELAVEWANRLDELAAIRAGMRELVHRSPLCDAERFSKDFLDVLEQAGQAKAAAQI